MKTVLVIGGTGVFGERLARHLARHTKFDVTITSRSAAKAAALADELGVRGIALDTGHELANRLAELKPWAVVDCSGPFQNANHDTARAAMEAGAHVIDLADARAYLLGYQEALDATAKANGLRGVAGASSTPALSRAVVRDITRGWRRVDAIDIAIVPGGRGEVGRSVLDAVTSYAGRPVPIWKDGALAEATGWVGGRFVDVPGLGRRRVAPVETVDAELLGPEFAVPNRVTFCAGLESRAEQYGMETLARLRQRSLIPNLAPLVPILHKARAVTRLTTGDAGGMIVGVQGLDSNGQATTATWSLLARTGDGPQVPVLAAAAALRLLADGELEPGANIADIPLGAILTEAEPYAITTHLSLDPATCQLASSTRNRGNRETTS